MAPIIWYSIARGGRMSLAKLRLVHQNLKCSPIIAKAAFSTQQTAIDNSYQMQFVSMEHSQNRQLYTRNALGVEKLQLHQAYITQFYKNNKDDYIQRLTKYVEHGEIDHLVQDDVINLIGLADSVKHLDLIDKIISMLASNHKFFSSGWGTAMMRLYYMMNQVDRANENLRNEAIFGQLFNKKSCYRIAMTLLFNAGRYQDVVDSYYLACRKLEPTEKNGSPHHPGISVIAFAAYAKANTPESLNTAEKLYNEVDIDIFSSYLRMRVISFLAHLHINHGQPVTALNLISNSPFKNHVAMRELTTVALVKLNRYEDVVCHILKSLTNLERGNKLLLKDVYDKLQSSLNSITDVQVCQRLKDTLIELKQNGLVAEATLESLLYTGINNHKVVQQHDYNAGGMASQLAYRHRRLRLKSQSGKIS